MHYTVRCANHGVSQFEIKGGERGGRSKGGSANGDDSSTVLSYTGYVDRGARIEARFSKRPLKVRANN
jgi:hypothetical protein